MELPEIDCVLMLRFGDASTSISTSDPVAANSSNIISTKI
jgi:hypothetical protein